jgi:multiple sugar transport system permease protein
MYRRGIEQGEPDIAAALGVILIALVLVLSLGSRRLLERD